MKTILLVASLAFVTAHMVRAATITVTNTADNGAGSLRGALASAVDGDTINATGVSGTILLTSGELFVMKSVNIIGPGPGSLAVDGNAASRVFYINSNTVVSISSLTITNGSDFVGGGIYNEGLLTVESNTITGNASVVTGIGGGICNNGDAGSAKLTIVNSTIGGNRAFEGGGIFNGFLLGLGSNATLEIVNSTISGNGAGIGGGIENAAGILTVINSTISGNSGGFFGGAIANNYGTATVSSSTLSDNSAEHGGGIFWFGGKLTVENSTISSNIASGFGVGGISDGGLLTLNNSIVAMNTGPAAPDIAGSFIGSFNFIGGDPLLGPLADNGGPTLTMALLPAGPCIDAGDPGFVGPPEFDQRGSGFARVVGGRIDIGAFEVQPPADSDGDGVPDTIDQCPDTPSGDIVNSTGCSIAQLVPCEGSQSGGTWKNHGQYVSAVVEVAKDFLNAGLITRKQRTEIVTGAAHSDCGKRP